MSENLVMTHFPLKCVCHQTQWEIHLNLIKCKICGFREHFDLHDNIHSLIQMMKIRGCYYLPDDANKQMIGRPRVQLSNHYR